MRAVGTKEICQQIEMTVQKTDNILQSGKKHWDQVRSRSSWVATQTDETLGC